MEPYSKDTIYSYSAFSSEINLVKTVDAASPSTRGNTIGNVVSCSTCSIPTTPFKGTEKQVNVVIQEDSQYYPNYVVLSEDSKEKESEDSNEKKKEEVDTLLPSAQGAKSPFLEDYTSQFYIGSLTIIGLYILFRIIKK